MKALTRVIFEKHRSRNLGERKKASTDLLRIISANELNSL